MTDPNVLYPVSRYSSKTFGKYTFRCEYCDLMVCGPLEATRCQTCSDKSLEKNVAEFWKEVWS